MLQYLSCYRVLAPHTQSSCYCPHTPSHAPQPAAEAFEARCGIDHRYILNFGEEVVRGQSVFVLGQLLRYLEPLVRKMGGVSSWLVVSGAAAKGYVVECPSLADVQGLRFNKPTVILTKEVSMSPTVCVSICCVCIHLPCVYPSAGDRVYRFSACFCVVVLEMCCFGM